MCLKISYLLIISSSILRTAKKTAAATTTTTATTTPLYQQQNVKYMQSKLRIFTKKICPQNKTEAFTKSMNMYIWAIGTSNQL